MKNIALSCTNCKSHNYKKNKTNTINRLIIKKYCPKCKVHFVHQEEK